MPASEAVPNNVSSDSPQLLSVADVVEANLISRLRDLTLTNRAGPNDLREIGYSGYQSTSGDVREPITAKTDSIKLPASEANEETTPCQFIWDSARGLLGPGPMAPQSQMSTVNRRSSQETINGRTQNTPTETKTDRAAGVSPAIDSTEPCHACLFPDAQDISDAFTGVFGEHSQEIDRYDSKKCPNATPFSPTISDSATNSVFSSLRTDSTGRTTPDSGEEEGDFLDLSDQEEEPTLTPTSPSSTPLFLYVTPPSSPIFPLSPESSTGVTIFTCQFSAPGGGGVPLTHILGRRRGCMVDPDEPAWGQDALYLPASIKVDLSLCGIETNSVDLCIRCSCTRMTRAHLAWRIVTSFAAQVQEDPYLHEIISELCLKSIDVSPQADGTFVATMDTES